MNNKDIKNFLDKKAGFDIAKITRETEYINYRCIYYFLSFKHSSQIVTNSNVAKEVNKDHATVIHGITTFKNLYETDRDFKNLTDRLDAELKKLLPVRVRRSFNCVDSLNEIALKRKVKNLMVKNKELMTKIKLNKAS